MRVLYLIVSIALVSCTVTSGTLCQNPVHDACSMKAQQVSAELAKVAAEQHQSAQEMTNEFIGACEGQLQADLDQTLPALENIVDAGAQDAGKDSSK
jgi:hypothetical protein